MTKRSLDQLKNIGKTVAQRLNEIGVFNEADLASVGSVEAYKRIEARFPGKTLPVCYYLYSLEAALLDIHWNDLPRELKKELEQQVRPPKSGRRRP